VQEIPLDRVVPGTFMITVTSDQPVVVAARTLTADSSDFAWFGAATPLAASTLVAVAQGPGGVLHLGNTTGATIAATVEAPGGSTQTVSVPANGAVGVPATSAGSYTIQNGKNLVASLSYSGTGALSSSLVSPPGPQQTPITVYPQ
jgi:hypothetical protein